MNFNRTYFLAALFSCSTIVSFSQLRDRDDESKTSLQRTQQQQQISGSTLSVVMDGPVDPKEYIVGPGDIFAVSIWTAVPLNFQIPVTPEGSVIIPTVNEIQVSGLTLETAKKNVIAEIKKKYLSGQASFTLSQPRSFTVTIRGMVLNEQTIVVQATDRVEAAINVANDIQKYKSKSLLSEQQLTSSGMAEKILSSSSKRHIRIIRKNGTSVNADIEKYIATRNHIFNPLLQDGDVIIVPPNNIGKNFIGVYGAVAKSGNYEFVEGDSLLTLIEIAGGITKNADANNVTISRLDESSNYTEQSVNILKIIEKQNSDIALRQGDRVIVAQSNTTDRGGVVNIEGEVVSPGSYSIIQDSTKLSEIIQKSGGYTKFALLNGAVVFRNRVRAVERETNYLQMRKGYTTNEDTAYFTNEIALRNNQEIISVDFVALVEKNDLSKDVALRDGDRIIIPSKTNSVYVFGEVKSPGFISYNKGENADFYIASAGGQTDLAESGDIKIIKAGSKQWLSVGETTVEEGDYVWVPKEPYRPISYYLTIYSQVFGIVGTMVSLVILVTR